MKPKVLIVDYGMGNLLSVSRALEHCGADVLLGDSREAIASAERLILPGVGAFGAGMAELQERNLSAALKDYARTGRPLLGICLGMQMLFEGSDEFGASVGLGVIPGWVRRLPTQQGMKLPHIGWSALKSADRGRWALSLLAEVPEGEEFYFVHSYFAQPAEPGDVLALTAYGSFDFCSVVQRGNITGCQFHPEKSGSAGLGMIKEFLKN